MIAQAKLSYMRSGPRKVRLVADVIRGKSVPEAMSLLYTINKKSCFHLKELLKSAVSNVKVKYPEEHYPEDALYISKITVDGGPMLKRFRAASMGRAVHVRKRTSHIIIGLDLIPEKLQAIKEAKEKKKDESRQPKSEAQSGAKKGKKKAALKGSK